MKLIAQVAAIAFLAFLAAIMFGGGHRDGTTKTAVSAGVKNDAIRRCYERGIAYFKEIGSYPMLSDGRLAGDVAAERCGRSKLAF